MLVWCILDTYIESGKDALEIFPDCSCSDFVKLRPNSLDFGMCQSMSSCYVNKPSNCADLVYDNSTGRNYSKEACLNYIGTTCLIH